MELIRTLPVMAILGSAMVTNRDSRSGIVHCVAGAFVKSIAEFLQYAFTKRPIRRIRVSSTPAFAGAARLRAHA